MKAAPAWRDPQGSIAQRGEDMKRLTMVSLFAPLKSFMICFFLFLSVLNAPAISEEAKNVGSGTVGLTIDFSNGVQKIFTGIPWSHNMDVMSVLEAAADQPPGLTFAFMKSMVDRGGREVGNIQSIDGVAGPKPGQTWLMWINTQSMGGELRKVIPQSVSTFGLPKVQSGDHILMKLVEGGQQ